MLSMRAFARSAPRALGRMTAAVARQSTAVAGRGAFVQSSAMGGLRTAGAAFSSTAGRRAAGGETDDELSAKLESEIQVEEDMNAEEQQPASVKDFLDSSPFELIDTPGQESVKLVRSFGDERITVSFSVSDIANYDPYQDDPALEDDDLSDEALQQATREDGTQTGGRSNGAEEDMDEEDMEDGGDETAAPISLSVVVEKPGKTAGALNIDATAQDGTIVVESMYFYEDANLAKVETPDSAQQRANVYPGPPFGSLDEDLQVMMERFLEERGITQAMAVFVPDYVDVKEQREYLRWLGNVKAFVDA